MKRYKKNLALLLAAVTAVLSAGCEIEEVPRAAVEEERQVLEEASSLAYTGDLEDITLTSDLTADGVIAGSIKETGFWNTKYTVTAGGEDWFYLGDQKDNFIYNLEGVNSGTTYAYYDMDDNCLGYAQTRIMETDGLEHDWYIVFLDADGNIRADYLTDERCHYVMDFDGNVLGTCSATGETFSDKYEVKVQMNEGEQMDLMDKVAICRQLAHWYAFDHSY